LRALVQCDTRAIGDSPEAAAQRLKLAQRVVLEGAEFVVESMMPRLFSDMTIAEQPEIVAATRRVMQTSPVEGIAAAARGMAVRENFLDQLEQIEVPTLIVVGEHDVIATPEEMRFISEAIPDSVWLQMPGVGHMAPLENPKVFNEALAEFITL
jgi:pimeloyl-ACP methyl ester carboxylesterase